MPFSSHAVKLERENCDFFFYATAFNYVCLFQRVDTKIIIIKYKSKTKPSGVFNTALCAAILGYLALISQE